MDREKKVAQRKSGAQGFEFIVFVALLALAGCGDTFYTPGAPVEVEDDQEPVDEQLDPEGAPDQDPAVIEGDEPEPAPEPMFEPEPTPEVEPEVEVPDEPVVLDCDLCAQCGEGAQECRAVCEGVGEALEPEHAAGWWSCVREDPCQIERAWVCFEGLDCDAERMIAAHCEGLGRCANDGRGYFDEAACRADPYSEPSQWACLLPSRREAVSACLGEMACGELEPCLSNAACAGDPACSLVMSTRLVVDCHRICLREIDECGVNADNGARMRGCMSSCDNAAFRLGDAERREVEACALEGMPCSSSVIAMCASGLECGGAPLEDMLAAAGRAQDRCFASPAPREDLLNWACLGQVLRSAAEICMDESPCGQMGACLERATCGDDPGCLDFLSTRQ